MCETRASKSGHEICPCPKDVKKMLLGQAKINLLEEVGSEARE